MNHRHHYHAGNFADVFKHTLLLTLIRRLQVKEKGFLFLDTHAGRGVYDLALAVRGDTLARQPEWPEGISQVEATDPAARPEPVRQFLEALEAFRREATGRAAAPGPENPPALYPGSPRLAARALRSQDRMVCCERHPEEHAILADEMAGLRRVRVECTDGYGAIRAHLPPLERRALVLIDPPYEAPDEFDQVRRALIEGLRRLPGGIFAVWYPLTERADAAAFFDQLGEVALPPTLAAEIVLAGPEMPLKLRGCGLLVLNPPWQFDLELKPVLPWLARALARGPGASSRLRWLAPE